MGIWGSGGDQRGRKRGEGPPPVEFCPPQRSPHPPCLPLVASQNTQLRAMF